ncbi:MAG: fatty acid desaturase [Deltaproteobacteria bacterium]|nr:fatty acid desaturase [Deltaproteobacteria bacterium]
MSALASALTTQPFTQLRRNKYFYLYYDGFYAVLFLAFLGATHVTHFQGLVPRWDDRLWLLLPVAFHVQILCSVFIHNATHGNWPKAVNRIVGEICALPVLSRFASWEVIHQRHHRYSDDVEKDPHPVVSSYWAFLAKTFVGVEKQLQQISFELYGDTPERRRYEKFRAVVSFGTMVLLVLCWWKLLGTVGFLFLFLPSWVVMFLHLIHFNWSTHNGFNTKKDFKPVNLDHGFYWIGNRIWFGIYYHANHHKVAKVFNPQKMPNGLPLTVPE